MDKYVKLSAIEKMAEYKEPASKSADMEEDAAENENGEESQDWGCTGCGTTVCATMPEKKMSCPCCGEDMTELPEED